MRAAGEQKKVKMPEKCTVFSFCHYNKAVTFCCVKKVKISRWKNAGGIAKMPRTRCNESWEDT